MLVKGATGQEVAIWNWIIEYLASHLYVVNTGPLATSLCEIQIKIQQKMRQKIQQKQTNDKCIWQSQLQNYEDFVQASKC